MKRVQQKLIMLAIHGGVVLSVGLVFSLMSTKAEAVTRTESIEIAKEYVELKWTPNANNIGSNGCGSNNYFSPGEEVKGMAYAFGKESTIDEFKSGIQQGKQTGYPDLDCEVTYAVGVDCSGLIQRAWGITYHPNTYTLLNDRNLTTVLGSYADLRKGDIVVYRYSDGRGHAMLFEKKDGNLFTFIEATISGDKVVRRYSYTSTELSNLGFQPRRYKNIEEDPLKDDINAVNSIVFNGYLIQTVRAHNNGIYSRSTSDGIFDESTQHEKWYRAKETTGSINSVVFNPGDGARLYQTHRGLDLKIYTRYTTDGIFDNSSVNEYWITDFSGGQTSSNIGMGYLNINGENRLYQAIKSKSSTGMYMRTIYPSYSNWGSISGQTNGDVFMYSYNGLLIQTVRGVTSGTIFSRATADGIFDNSDGREIWDENGSTYGQVNSIIYNGTLQQYVVGASTPYIYKRESTTGTFENSTWTTDSLGKSGGDIDLVIFQPEGITEPKVMQSFKGNTTDNIYIKYDGSTNYYQLPGQTKTNIDLQKFEADGIEYMYISFLGKSSDTLYSTKIRNLDEIEGTVWGPSNTYIIPTTTCTQTGYCN